MASTLNNLANVYQAQRRYAEAEPLYRRALAIQEQALGPDDPAVSYTLHNIAVAAAALQQLMLAINDIAHEARRTDAAPAAELRAKAQPLCREDCKKGTDPRR